METSTNGAGAAVEAAAAGREDQGGVAELGFGAGGRAAPGVPAPGEVPDPELIEQAKRRTFTAKYKARILAEADACTAPGEVGELLRREGLYTSHLTYWRKQRKDGALKELGKPRGRKPADRRDEQIAKLERKLERSESELVKMKRVVEIQGGSYVKCRRLWGGCGGWSGVGGCGGRGGVSAIGLPRRWSCRPCVAWRCRRQSAGRDGSGRSRTCGPRG